jgi:phosphate acetyltransferase
MLSYSTKGSAHSELTDKVIEATRLAKEKAPDLALDGELQLDAAIDAGVASSKAPGSDVAGYRQRTGVHGPQRGQHRLQDRTAAGQGRSLRPDHAGHRARPVNDLSRGCVADDIVGVAAITAVQAMD